MLCSDWWRIEERNSSRSKRNSNTSILTSNATHMCSIRTQGRYMLRGIQFEKSKFVWKTKIIFYFRNEWICESSQIWNNSKVLFLNLTSCKLHGYGASYGRLLIVVSHLRSSVLTTILLTCVVSSHAVHNSLPIFILFQSLLFVVT